MGDLLTAFPRTERSPLDISPRLTEDVDMARLEEAERDGAYRTALVDVPIWN